MADEITVNDARTLKNFAGSFVDGAAAGGVITPKKDSGTKASVPIVKPIANRAELSEAKKILNREDDKFFIKYKDPTGKQKTFTFALLPAIESNLQISTSGSIRGNGANVPEVKPGIMQRTMMRHKNIIIPGGVSVVQTIGVDNTILQLVGTFIGTEVNQDTLAGGYKLNGIYESADGSRLQPSASKKANDFVTEVVHSGTPVDITVTSFSGNANGNETLNYTGVITNFKTYTVRRNRVYYAMDILITKYAITDKVKGKSAEFVTDKEAQRLAEEALKNALNIRFGGASKSEDKGINVSSDAAQSGSTKSTEAAANTTENPDAASTNNNLSKPVTPVPNTTTLKNTRSVSRPKQPTLVSSGNSLITGSISTPATTEAQNAALTKKYLPVVQNNASKQALITVIQNRINKVGQSVTSKKSINLDAWYQRRKANTSTAEDNKYYKLYPQLKEYYDLRREVDDIQSIRL